MKELEQIQNKIINNGNCYKITLPTEQSSVERNYFRISQLANNFLQKNRFNNWYKHLALQDDENKNLSEAELIKIGEKEGNKKKNNQAKKGTQKHKNIENFFKNREKNSMNEWKLKLENFFPFVNIFNPLCIEKKVFYENFFNKMLQITPNGKLLGLAGTFDALGTVDCNALSFEKNGKSIYKNSLQFLIDWKYPSKAKYPVKKYKNQTIYPLIPYGIQLSCYIAAINQRTNGNLNLNRAIVVIAPENSNTCYPYLFSKDSILWYWENAKKMMVSIAFNENFDYTVFENETVKRNFHGTRLYFR